MSAIALALCAYLSLHYLLGASVIGCAGGNSCDQLLSSRWATIGGLLPVSGLAAGTYLAILAASLFTGPAAAAPDRRLAWSAMLILVGAATGSAVWFTVIQRWVVGTFCPFCMATHVIGLLLAALVLWQAPKQLRAIAATSAERGTAIELPLENVSSVVRRRMVRRLFAIGIALACMLVACQVSIAPAVAYRSGASQVSERAFNPHAVPLIGSPDAAYVVNLLFDYQCPHCQRMHFMLDELIRRYRGKLAFALCPAPLNTRCNPYVARDADQFKDSCELAKISLAVWLANPKSFPAFDDWMFSLDSGDFWHPRSVDAARAKAAESVGQSNFDAALTDPWIQAHLQSSVKIYGDTIDLVRGGNALPKLVFGPHWVTPGPNNVEDFVSILHDGLGLPSDPTALSSGEDDKANSKNRINSLSPSVDTAQNQDLPGP
jgi:uncharacterized membrane protein